MSNSIPKTTVLKKCLSALNVEKYRCPFHDHGAKKLLTGQTIALLIEAQLHARNSLDEVSENLNAQKELQNYLQLDSLHASTIHRKLENLPTDYLKSLYQTVIKRIGERYVSHCGLPDLGLLGIIDATEISLPERAKWAYCTKDKNGVKVHTRLRLFDSDHTLADKIIPSTAAVADHEVAESLVDDKSLTYVFDRGYIKFHLYHHLEQNDISFVARVKANTKLPILCKQAVVDDHIILDADVEVIDRKTEEPFILRLIEYLDDDGKRYRVVTNRWDLDASDIAEVYRLRWRIELFFKWIKQHLKVIKWFNHKPEAVWNQIYIIMIAYALCEWIKLLVETDKTSWSILKLIRNYWLNSWEKLLEIIHRKPSRTSNGRKKKGKPGRPRKRPKQHKSVKIIKA